jgi:hypothetical protein
MFSPRVDKPGTKAAKSLAREPAHNQAALGAHPFGGGVAGLPRFLQRAIGNQITSPSWKFNALPLSSPIRPLRSQTVSSSAAWPHSGVIQTKLSVGDVNDPLEDEANRVADQVMRMPDPGFFTARAPAQISRKCASCENEERGNPTIEPTRVAANNEAPAVVHQALRAPAQPLDPASRAYFELRLGHNLSQVRVHHDSVADASAHAVNALAYTVGEDIVFRGGQYAPHTRSGQHLLAHELTHVVQQSGAGSVDRRVGKSVQRAETLGTKVTEPAGVTSPFSVVTATFDGATFTMVGDGKSIVQASAQSGHPNQVEASDAAACKGAADDSYLNNPRYVGIKDKGAIPEGSYTFRHSAMVTFTGWEDAKMALATPGQYVDPSGLDLHGDWGAARAALTPIAIAPSKFCGSTASRSGFYLHGGVMTGSSGCIDIGNAAVTSVVQNLMGYTKPVKVTVKYTVPAPTVGPLDRAAGRFMYPPSKNAGLWDRLKSAAGFGDK